MSKPKQLDAVSSFTGSLESQALDSDGTAAPRTYICLRIRREWGAYRAPLIEVVLVCRSSDLKDSAQGRCMSPSKEHSKLKRSGILSICDLHASKGRMKGLGTDRVRQIARVLRPAVEQPVTKVANIWEVLPVRPLEDT